MISFPFSLKSLSEAGQFEGLASTYGNVDQGGDVVEAGAFTATIAKRGPDIPVLWAHDHTNPVALGHLTDTAEGLHIRGDLDMDVQAGRDAYSRLKKRLVKGLSIGYRVLQDTVENGIRHLKQIDLYEVSLVVSPMNEQATVTAVKSITTLRDFEHWLHDRGFTKSQSRAIAMRGFAGLSSDPDESAAVDEFAAWLRQQTA